MSLYFPIPDRCTSCVWCEVLEDGVEWSCCALGEEHVPHDCDYEYLPATPEFIRMAEVAVNARLEFDRKKKLH